MLAMHSALNEYIYFTLRGILKRNGMLSVMKTAGAYYCRCHCGALTGLALTTNLLAR